MRGVGKRYEYYCPRLTFFGKYYMFFGDLEYYFNQHKNKYYVLREYLMNAINQHDQNVNEKIAQSLRQRAKIARRNANIALLSIFIILFSGISIFYYAGDIVIKQSKPLYNEEFAGVPLRLPITENEEK